MKRSLLDHLVCPECKTPLDLEVREEEEGQVKTGSLKCADSKHIYPISKFIPRFVDADKYAGTFSKQREYVRRHFKYYRQDTSGDRLFLPTTGLDEDWIRGGLCLEVGCGYGRFVDVVQRLGGEVVGIDLSTISIELAQEFVGLRDNVHLVQCDLYNQPFRPATFSTVYSIGVLHHTPSTREAFRAIAPYAKDGGRVSIWVYPTNMFYAEEAWRVITKRLPHSVLYGWCIVNQALFSWIRALPGGWRFSRIVPGGIPSKNSPFFWLRVVGDFDTLSPQYNHTHTPENVVQWFEEEGLTDVRALERQTAVTGVMSRHTAARPPP